MKVHFIKNSFHTSKKTLQGLGRFEKPKNPDNTGKSINKTQKI